jgi:hypothetical protein
MHTVLLTGVPRGGTTLLAALVDSLDDTLCLSEPPEFWDIAGRSTTSAACAAEVIATIASRRARLAAGEPVIDHRLADGSPPTDYYPVDTERPALYEVASEWFDDASLLGVKHNGVFTAILPELLAADLPVIAVVRDPLPTIRSWRANNLPIGHGQLDGKHLWPALVAATGGPAGPDRLARTYECIVARYVEHRDRLRALVRYEDLLADPSIIARIVGRAAVGTIDIRERAHPERLDAAADAALAAALRAHAPRTLELYPHLA